MSVERQIVETEHSPIHQLESFRRPDFVEIGSPNALGAIETVLERVRDEALAIQRGEIPIGEGKDRLFIITGLNSTGKGTCVRETLAVLEHGVEPINKTLFNNDELAGYDVVVISLEDIEKEMIARGIINPDPDKPFPHADLVRSQYKFRNELAGHLEEERPRRSKIFILDIPGMLSFFPSFESSEMVAYRTYPSDIVRQLQRQERPFHSVNPNQIEIHTLALLADPFIQHVLGPRRDMLQKILHTQEKVVPNEMRSSRAIKDAYLMVANKAVERFGFPKMSTLEEWQDQADGGPYNLVVKANRALRNIVHDLLEAKPHDLMLPEFAKELIYQYQYKLPPGIPNGTPEEYVRMARETAKIIYDPRKSNADIAVLTMIAYQLALADIAKNLYGESTQLTIVMNEVNISKLQLNEVLLRESLVNYRKQLNVNTIY